MRLTCRSWLRLLTLSGLFACGLSAQPKPPIGGDYAGLLGTLHVELHITAAPDGSLSGTLDSLDQGSKGNPCPISKSTLALSQNFATKPSTCGKLNGIKGSGTCTGKGEQSGAVTFDCIAKANIRRRSRFFVAGVPTE